MSDIKIRAKLEGEETRVKCLITHPMENGLRRDSQTNELIPAHFIQEVVCKVKGAVVMRASWSGAVSKNPYLSFRFKGGALGDPIEIAWTDNKGESGSATAQIV
ncbi:thiosulfate oxidation carrier complex protein SoxZ [Thermochromatium tepidum]|uniref:Thiosulfate oxidation carrier complex protein SoxZ n=1 Tax=Thermochromatium tepidum ATCC 43061 TaxID=316276 RepID=A0A6I6EBU7_THETI|nr:thiosulfate oxidation carrier complex protein SoxZ [Thermochromatium tepidum]QGU31630.1 thiosulfate oxidation carrier complex protein SoxZ [Thermochromatium tepidum ATCC 43061]